MHTEKSTSISSEWNQNESVKCGYNVAKTAIDNKGIKYIKHSD
jgi:hypothetical protein